MAQKESESVNKKEPRHRVSADPKQIEELSQALADGRHSKRGLRASTKMNYLMVAKQLIERYETEKRASWSDSKMDFSNWANMELAPTIAPSVRRQYRAALRYLYSVTPEVTPADAPDFLLREPRKKRSDTDVARKRTTSATKSKGISKDAYYRLAETLSQRDSLMPQMAGAMIVASRTFGLRPSEWLNATLTEQGGLGVKNYQLKIKNAKHDEERSFGEYRTLLTDSQRIEAHEIEAAYFLIDAVGTYVRLAIEEVMSPEKSDEPHKPLKMDDEENQQAINVAIKSMLNSMNRAVRSARKESGVREHVTLYSARHQFAADAKASNCSLEEIAAMMGHGSLRTASESYGRRKRGWGGANGGGSSRRGFRITPSEQDVQAVQQRNSQFEKIINSKTSVAPKWAPGG